MFAELINYLGILYNIALVGPERNERGGYVVCLKLHKDLKYERLYFEFSAYDKKPAEEPGFVTKDSNKATIVAGRAAYAEIDRDEPHTAMPEEIVQAILEALKKA